MKPHVVISLLVVCAVAGCINPQSRSCVPDEFMATTIVKNSRGEYDPKRVQMRDVIVAVHDCDPHLSTFCAQGLGGIDPEFPHPSPMSVVEFDTNCWNIVEAHEVEFVPPGMKVPDQNIADSMYKDFDSANRLFVSLLYWDEDPSRSRADSLINVISFVDGAFARFDRNYDRFVFRLYRARV